MARLDLNRWFRDCVKQLRAYHVEEFDCAVKLHANESPFPPPQNLLDAVCPEINRFKLNRYPDPSCAALRATLARRLRVRADQIVIGNGSDELIQFILQIFCADGDAIAYPDPTFSMYGIIARGHGLNPVAYPLNDRWDFRADAFLGAMRKHRPRVIFLSYPNNPTGNCFSHEEVLKVVRRFKGIVVVDEAYHDFSEKTFLPFLADNNNLIVLRSLSKIGLAALRVGFGVAHPDIIAQINKVRLPYNSNTVSQTLAERVMRNFSGVEKQLKLIRSERDRMMKALRQISGLTVFASDSNFFLIRPSSGSGETLFKQLADRGILVRYLGSHPRLKDCLRVTVGAKDENNRFLSEMESLSSAKRRGLKKTARR